jgi:hypothetical protein
MKLLAMQQYFNPRCCISDICARRNSAPHPDHRHKSTGTDIALEDVLARMCGCHHCRSFVVAKWYSDRKILTISVFES